ncbi:MAG: phospholipase D-like domain-containing protein [Ktedonobacterales bacterium]
MPHIPGTPRIRASQKYHCSLLGISLALLLLLLLLTACDAGSTLTSTVPSTEVGTNTPQAGSPAETAPCIQTSCAASSVQVFVEPDAGDAPIVHAIENAQSSVWVEVYLMTDHAVIQALEDAAGRGVQVRVLLETHPAGGGSPDPTQLIEELSQAGVQAKASDPAFTYTHEKAMVIDGRTAFIMSCNLTLSGLGGSSSEVDRDYGLIDSNPADVGEVMAIFNADWNRQPAHVTVSRLVVSPENSRADLQALIASAHTSLLLEDEEMSDTQSENALIAAAHQGVRVELILPMPSSSSGTSPDVSRLESGGVQVRYSTTLYMHAKLIIVDSTLGFIGSENFSANSLNNNRELGIVIGDLQAVGMLTSVFAKDWSQAQPA